MRVTLVLSCLWVALVTALPPGEVDRSTGLADGLFKRQRCSSCRRTCITSSGEECTQVGSNGECGIDCMPGDLCPEASGCLCNC
ncbi:uncharacterized protein RCC_06848 [Ramularia collo-cygni]|uniref:Uncharacterized protein n=1 Tax=Ramularia collo-cygni TaxID=112498 RepID=A0A2D3V897_9PEZI|nr:uncharacterized protein RCC_06848 [Ramularia collo-cygni]CZT20987.1 uncharacterized protein RCC_06848 [Ramularia collo-cygni]